MQCSETPQAQVRSPTPRFHESLVTDVNGMMDYMAGNATSHPQAGGSALSLAVGDADDQHHGLYYHIPSGMSTTSRKLRILRSSLPPSSLSRNSR